MNLEENILFFLIVWIGVFLVDYFILLKPRLKGKKTKKKKTSTMEVDYLRGKFKLKEQDIMKKSIFLWIAFLNSFIISFVSTVITMLPIKFAFQLIIGFALLFILIFIIYEIFGRVLKRRINKNE